MQLEVQAEGLKARKWPMQEVRSERLWKGLHSCDADEGNEMEKMIEGVEPQAKLIPEDLTLEQQRRHTSLPVEVSEIPLNLIDPACRRSYPCRKWKSASFG
ncbi:hypothetical protein EYF80_010102 [Liparis tanakae]|uniref:Uncharacterized protein n=1 Tax=Liparis tanakae TaxID=230148 RepID=A0A4Z2IPX5_9TELE|nr:hypothetical protein EYF80_010102 [Liparis tanakae]